MPVRVENLAQRPSATLSLRKNRRGIARIDDRGFAARLVTYEPDVIVGKGRNGHDIEHHHSPTLGIDAQGSEGGSASPFCKSSIEILSGLLTKAMWPSRGGRLIVTPPSISRRQKS